MCALWNLQETATHLALAAEIDFDAYGYDDDEDYYDDFDFNSSEDGPEEDQNIDESEESKSANDKSRADPSASNPDKVIQVQADETKPASSESNKRAVKNAKDADAAGKQVVHCFCYYTCKLLYVFYGM